MTLAFDPAHLRSALERAAGLIEEFYATLESRSVEPPLHVDEVRARLAGTLGEEGIGLSAALDEVEQHILPGSLATPHPRYMGLFNSSPLPGGVVADALVSALNNNTGSTHQAPALTAAEDESVRAFAELLGYPAHARGLFLPGGSYANLQGLELARTARLPQWRREGPQALSGAPRLYTSDASHFSVLRAGHSLGLGQDDVVAVPTTGRGALDPRALDELVAADRRAGALPFAVVATLGTTGTAAIDPLPEIAAVAREHDLWLHVDACYGGAAALLEEIRPQFDAIESADSVAVDPHKWFFVPMIAALLLTRHADVIGDAYEVPASYIPGAERRDYWQSGLPTSRRAMGFTTWFALRAHGLSAVRRAVRRNTDLTRQLEVRLAAEGFRVMPAGELSVACARSEPEGLDAQALDTLQDELGRRVRASGVAWLATTWHAGQSWLRMNLVNLHTGEEDIEKVVTALCAARDELR